jgi:hypothetical protein
MAATRYEKREKIRGSRPTEVPMQLVFEKITFGYYKKVMKVIFSISRLKHLDNHATLQTQSNHET